MKLPCGVPADVADVDHTGNGHEWWCGKRRIVGYCVQKHCEYSSEVDGVSDESKERKSKRGRKRNSREKDLYS